MLDMHGYMARALELAKRGKGWTNPNPMVGAVVVQNGQIVGEGYHQRAGGPHAEVHALQAAGEQARGADLYVTLEPCCHHGRTPPCTEAIIARGIRRVFVACLDPNPRVSGGGVDQLREAGIGVQIGIGGDEARRLNEFFMKFMSTNLPFVTLKWAMTADGKIATVRGESRWITSPSSRQLVHQLRHEHAAILVGANTVLIDNPALTTRLHKGIGRDACRVVIDPQLETPPDALVINSSKSAPCLIFHGEEADRIKAVRLADAGAELVSLPLGHEGLFDLQEVLRILAEHKLISVLVEGGSAVHGAFISAGLVDKIYAFVAPLVVGGKQAPCPVAGAGIASLKDAIRLKEVMWQQLEQDICLTGYVRRG